MNRNSKRLSVYISLMLLGTVAATALRTVALFSSLDEWGYFSDKGLFTAAVIVAAVTSVIMLSYPLSAAKLSLVPSFSSPETYVPTGIMGVGVAFMLVGYIRELSTMLLNAVSPSAVLSRPFGISLLIAIPFSILSLVHLFWNAYYTEGHSTARAWASLGTVLMLAAYSATLYFSTELPINSPNKTTDGLAFLAATAFFLYEARISLGREMWRGYTAVGLIAAHLCAFSSIPSLILYTVRGEAASRSVEENVLCFALFIFIISRLILTVKLREDGPTAGILAIRQYADERAEATAEATERHAHAFAIQMTIDDLIAEEGAAPVLIAEESAIERESTEPEEADADEGLDAISIFDTDEVMRAAVSLPDPEPLESDDEPLLIISDVDTPDAPVGYAEDEEETAADGEGKSPEGAKRTGKARGGRPRTAKKKDAAAKIAPSAEESEDTLAGAGESTSGNNGSDAPDKKDGAEE